VRQFQGTVPYILGYFGLGLAQLLAAIKIEVEDFRPDPFKQVSGASSAGNRPKAKFIIIPQQRMLWGPNLTIPGSVAGPVFEEMGPTIDKRVQLSSLLFLHTAARCSKVKTCRRFLPKLSTVSRAPQPDAQKCRTVVICFSTSDNGIRGAAARCTKV
jgi:hypothetical protein